MAAYSARHSCCLRSACCLVIPHCRRHQLVVVTTGDTLVESPEVAEHYRNELGRMRKFGTRHGIRFVTLIHRESLGKGRDNYTRRQKPNLRQPPQPPTLSYGCLPELNAHVGIPAAAPSSISGTAFARCTYGPWLINFIPP